VAVETAPERVERLLGELDPASDARALAAVQAVVELYGSALARIVAQVGPGTTSALAGDELVGHLLLVHDLHPLGVEERVREALAGVRPYLESHGGDVELLAVEGSVARVRLQGSCDGCPASAMTLKLAIEEAVLAAAPDVERVEAQQPPAGGGLLQIECAPAFAAARREAG
jgi:Fe-S cluster biogenesis protein NfuA